MNNKGYITLLSVLIIGAVGVSISSSLLLLGVNATKTTSINEQSNEAKALANACAEIARQNIANTITYTGTGNLSLNGGSCTFAVTNPSSTTKLVNASGTYNSVVRKLRVNLTVSASSPSGVVSSTITEVSDF